MELCCAVCGESKITNLLMFNYGMCLCHRCTEIAAQSFIHDTAERKLKESEKKQKASRIAEAAIKFANGTHESLMCNCPGCGKLVPKKDMRLFGRGCYYNDHPTRLCPNCHEKKILALDIWEKVRELEKANQAFHNLKDEYESFRDRTSRVWWGVMIVGIAIGTLLTLMFLNPR